MQQLQVFEALGPLRMETMYPSAMYFNTRARKAGGKGLETHRDTRRPDGGGICKLRDGQGTSLILRVVAEDGGQLFADW